MQGHIQCVRESLSLNQWTALKNFSIVNYDQHDSNWELVNAQEQVHYLPMTGINSSPLGFERKCTEKPKLYKISFPEVVVKW